MVVCITSARFNMKADILRQGELTIDDPATPSEDEGGRWIIRQDPDSGEFIRVWQTNPNPGPAPSPKPNENLETFACIARGIVDGGIRVAGTTERFGGLYENIDYVFMTVGPKVKISKRDKITNIRNRGGIILWREEEELDAPPTVFSVLGVTPIPDPWGNLIEQRIMLDRSEIQ